ncbi:MAG: cation:proton antiporter [Novosphingobium sp.]
MEEQALVIAAVGVLGIGAQWVAWRTGWPAIVLMLAAGFLAGPVFHVIDPEHAFGPMLEPMISIGVALILFEGGLSLDFREFRKVGRGVMRLAVVGVPVGWFLGSLACYYIAGLVWPVAILFAGILVVTGPTVVIPLLRQSSVQQRPAAILKWEGIVNDPAGALCAVIAYEYFRLSATGTDLVEIVPPMLIAAGLSGLLGYAAAKAIAWAFPRGAVPEFLKVPVLLVTVIVVFVISNLIEHEAGLVAVTVMGIALANMHISSLRSIHPFKQNVAVLLVSGIFILLSASLDLESLRQFEWRFGLFLLALLFLVRPATILISLLFTDIPWNERLFLAWIAPRGIVLVAISGLFALRLENIGYGDGAILVGLSFAVVVTTIVAHGFTIDLVAKWLGVKGETRPGVLIVGSTLWSGALARQLAKLDIPVTIADSSFQRLAPARQSGVPIYHGEILNEATEHNLDLSPFQVLIAATDNEAYNALVCNEFAFEIGRDRVYQLGEAGDEHDYRALPASLTGRALFASGFGVDDVNLRQAQGWVFRSTRVSDRFTLDDVKAHLPTDAQFLMVLRKDGQLRFFTHAANPEPSSGDVVISYTPPDPPEQIAAEKAAQKSRKPAPERKREQKT